jgi:hypothetical protein
MAGDDTLTLEKIFELEPRLRVLMRLALMAHPKRADWFCANEVWYELYKPQLVRLVGWSAENTSLRSEHAYDLAYEAIYRQLPGCRNCCCWPSFAEEVSHGR